jgi:outer membrane protein assembly factor BamA
MVQHMRTWRCAALVGLSLLLPWHIRAQDAPQSGRPEVNRVSFHGAEALNEGELRDRIETQETRCRGTFLLQPFCWLTEWDLFFDRHFLDREELPRDVLRLRVHYFRRGYRQAAVRYEVQPHEDGVEVAFFIDEGPPTLLHRLDIHQVDDVFTRRQIRRAEFPEEDKPFDLYEFERALEHLQVRLGERGFLDASVEDTITVSGQSAEVDVFVDAGPRSRVGEIEVRGNEQVSDGVLIDALRLSEGGVLRTTQIRASQRSLYETNLFYEAHVEVPEQADSVKTVVVSVREAPPRSGRLGGGFNTVEFAQAEAVFNHYNWLGGGRRLDLRATVGNLLAPQLNNRLFFHDVLPSGPSAVGDDPFLRPTWQLSADFRQPAFQGASNRIGLGLFAHRRIIPAVAVDRGHGVSASLTRQLDFRTPVTLDYRFEITSVDAGDVYFCVYLGICEPPAVEAVSASNRLSPLSLNFLTDRSNDALSPSEGFRVRAELEHASAATISDFRYNRVSADGSFYYPFDVLRHRVLATRLRGGWVGPLATTADAIGLEQGAAVLHPRKRFYSGGSRSVRGYWENQLGPRVLTVERAALIEGGCTEAEIADGSCDPAGADANAFDPRPIGGTWVIEGGTEYRFPLFGDFRGAVFVDGAVVGDRPGGFFDRAVYAVTPGFGVRMESPFGPMRIDLGIRPRVAEHLPVVTEFFDEDGLRRLTPLDTRRYYDPIEAAGGGFLRTILARLRLHLSVGEAI